MDENENAGLREAIAQLTAQRDRLASLVGTAYNEDGTIIPALLAATAKESADEIRHEVNAVVGFLRDNNPNR